MAGYLNEMGDWRNTHSLGEVVMLHRVSADTHDPWPGRDMVDTPSQLECFIEKRARGGWSPVSWTEAIRRPPEMPWYVLTFDDGFRDNLYEALPILERHGVPAVVFVTVGFISRDVVPFADCIAALAASRESLKVDGRWNTLHSGSQRDAMLRDVYRRLCRGTLRSRNRALDRFMASNEFEGPRAVDEKYLCWDEVREIGRHPLITIGAHSWTHPCMSRVPPWELAWELYAARRRIEQEVNTRVTLLSYPHGNSNWIVRQLAKLSGYEYGFTTRERPIRAGERVDSLSIPRRRMDLSRACD